VARLKGDVITYIVTQLACFERPAEIQRAVRETFGVETTLVQVLYYDPEHSPKLAKKWVRFHANQRAAFTRETARIPIANRAYRLAVLQKLVEKDLARGATAFVAQHLEQGAKEVGDVYTNRHQLESADPVGAVAGALGMSRDDVLAALGADN
jgi:hypothetical protein